MRVVNVESSEALPRKHVFSDTEYKAWLEEAREPLRSMSVLAHDRGICRNEMLALQKDCVTLFREPDTRGSWGQST
jgi:hypothetical protein